MDIFKLAKQAKGLQSKMQELQEGLSEVEVQGHSGGDLITVTLTGKGEMSGLSIDQSLIVDEDKEVLEDLIIAAHNEAKKLLEVALQQRMQNVSADLGLPSDFKMPF